MKKIGLLNGPNLDRLGKREPEIYGDQTLEQINEKRKQAGLEFDTEIRRPVEVEGTDEVAVGFELIVTAEGHEDRFIRSVPIRPFGMSVFGTAGGAATSDTTAWVELPADMPAESLAGWLAVELPQRLLRMARAGLLVG